MITADLLPQTIFDSVTHVSRLERESAGLMLSRDEFLAIDDFDDHYRYELLHGVVVVSPFPGPAERGPNGVLEHWLWTYHESHPEQSTLDDTLSEQAIDTGVCIRRADRVIWVGLGRQPVPMADIPAIVVEFVSSSKRDRKRDYEAKRSEYAAIGVSEYWIFDRFRRTLTVCRGDAVAQVIKEGDIFETPLLPAFRLALGELLKVADRWAGAQD
jgi:Uma2 family endonuclease